MKFIMWGVKKGGGATAKAVYLLEGGYQNRSFYSLFVGTGVKRSLLDVFSDPFMLLDKLKVAAACR